MQVEWNKLAAEVGAVNVYGTHLGLAAIEKILGEEFFRQAVEYSISLREGWCLSEGVLRILRPLGMKHCYDIYQTSTDPEERRSAVWLLKYTADREVLAYLPEFLADPDENIQVLVFQILDQLWFHIQHEDIIAVLGIAANHPRAEIRQLAKGLASPDPDTIQSMAEFTDNLTNLLGQELYLWGKRLKFETIRGLDLLCIPWLGQLEFSFLTDREDFDLSLAYSEKYYPKWRLNNLPWSGSKIEEMTNWMQTEVEKSGASLQSTELFLAACVTSLKSSRVQKVLRKYYRSPDFQVTIFNPNSSSPRRNLYST